MLYITIFVLICFLIFLIKKRNLFVLLYSDIENAKSQVQTAKAKCLEVEKKSLGLAGKAQENDRKEIQNVMGTMGTINASDLHAIGELHPDFKDKFGTGSELSHVLYSEYRDAQTRLNEAITAYNMAIAVFPQNIAAMIWGYKKEDLIGQENLEDAKKLEMAKEVDISKFV